MSGAVSVRASPDLGSLYFQVTARDARPRAHSHLSTSEVDIARALLSIPDQASAYPPATPLNDSCSVTKIRIPFSVAINTCGTSTSTTTTSVSKTSPSLSQSLNILRGSTCPQCGKMFRGDYHKYNLKKHLTIHAGLRPYPCPICNMAFNQKVSMKRHYISVHKTMEEIKKYDS